MQQVRVLIVSENISMRMGGEASLPFYYAKLLSARGAEVWMVCHERVESELRTALPYLEPRMLFVRDTKGQKLAFRYGRFLPPRLREMLIGQGIHLSTQMRIRKIAISLASAAKIDVVFEPSPITPKGLSFLYDVGVPVVIGPMCGGMTFPPAFAHLDSAFTRGSMALGRQMSHLANRIVPGKLKADVLMVANSSTSKALPAGYRGQVVRVFESGVDLDLWKKMETRGRAQDKNVHFVFSGRFVDWKGIQYLVPAFAKAFQQEPSCRLDLIGGGELESEVKTLVEQNQLSDVVRFNGWLNRQDAAGIIADTDVFVMPSLRECGGTAILEAMALGKPVIATNWGGPADYINESCGLLVEPHSKTGFIDGLSAAMVLLARSPELRKTLGDGGKARVHQDYLDWESKTSQILSILTEVIERRKAVTV
jgi:glycosyltransferase involved in cell wall biosynthesis